MYVPKNLFHLPSELLHQELAGGDADIGADLEEVGAGRPAGDVEGGGEARGRTVEEAVPKGVGQRGGRKKDALAEHEEDVQGGGR